MPDDLAILGGTPTFSHQLPSSVPVSDAEVQAVVHALRSAPLTTLFGGYEVGAFEDEFRTRMGADNAVAVTSGTTALHAALSAASVGPGAEVIVTPYSFVATASVIVQVGATPVFVDIDPETLALDATAARRALTARTRAIIVVHHSGMPCDVHAFVDLARENGICLIEDCAISHGASVGGRSVGTFGDFGCFSFNIAKLIRTGEGGMVLCKDPGAAERLRELRVNGIASGESGTYVKNFGTNYTMAHPLAAIGRVQLREFDESLRLRARNWKIVESALPAGFESRANIPDREPVCYWMPLRLSAELTGLRDIVVRALRAENIVVGTRSEPLYRVPYLSPFTPDGGCPNAEARCNDTIFIDPLPCYTEDDMEGIALALEKVASGAAQLRELAPRESNVAQAGLQ